MTGKQKIRAARKKALASRGDAEPIYVYHDGWQFYVSRGDPREVSKEEYERLKDELFQRLGMTPSDDTVPPSVSCA